MVVEPDGVRGVGQVKHRAHHYDADWNELGESFAVTRWSADVGEPADHRVAYTGDGSAVVYQTLLWKDDNALPSGPAEAHAKERSLMLATIDPDGHERFRGSILAHVTDFQTTTFPDHCLAWLGDRLLVQHGGNALYLREVSLNGAALAQTSIALDTRSLRSAVGNSLLLATAGTPPLAAHLLGAADLHEGALVRLDLASDWSVTGGTKISVPDLEMNFPTSALAVGDLTLVAHLGRAPGGDPAPEQNPYDVYLTALGPDGTVVAQVDLGGPTFGHGHPTLARDGDTVLVAWSHAVDLGDRTAPEVIVDSVTLGR